MITSPNPKPAEAVTELLDAPDTRHMKHMLLEVAYDWSMAHPGQDIRQVFRDLSDVPCQLMGNRRMKRVTRAHYIEYMMRNHLHPMDFSWSLWNKMWDYKSFVDSLSECYDEIDTEELCQRSDSLPEIRKRAYRYAYDDAVTCIHTKHHNAELLYELYQLKDVNPYILPLTAYISIHDVEEQVLNAAYWYFMRFGDSQNMYVITDSYLTLETIPTKDILSAYAYLAEYLKEEDKDLTKDDKFMEWWHQHILPKAEELKAIAETVAAGTATRPHLDTVYPEDVLHDILSPCFN